MEFDYNTKETRAGIEEGVSLEVELYAIRVMIEGEFEIKNDSLKSCA